MLKKREKEVLAQNVKVIQEVILVHAHMIMIFMVILHTVGVVVNVTTTVQWIFKICEIAQW